MDEKQAKKILGSSIKDDGIARITEYILWVDDGSNTVILDGNFNADELEAIAWWMKNKKNKV